VIAVSGKGSGRISIAGLVCVKPGRRSQFIYRTTVHRGHKGERRSFSERDYIALIDAAHQQLGGPIVLIWDKRSLGNLAVRGVDHLQAIIKNLLKSIQFRTDLLDGFLANTGLTLEPDAT
jgi:hypothetical protein